MNEAGESRPFIAGKVDIGEVQWTPDGRSIAFVSKRPGDETRHVRNSVDGGEARRVVAHSTDLRGVTSVADGNRSRCWPRIPLPKNSRISVPRDSSRRSTRRTCRRSRSGSPRLTAHALRARSSSLARHTPPPGVLTVGNWPLFWLRLPWSMTA